MNTQFQLDPLGRLKQQIAQPNSHNKADPAVLIGRRYQYDTIGNLVRTDDQTNGSRDYTYDALGRITQSADEHYRYDPAHNLTDGSRISGNRLTQYKGTSYRYDPLGNLIEKQQHDGEIQHYRYNADNQLAEAEIHRPGQNTVLYRYRYDPIGRRIAKVHPDGNEIQYLWDGSRLLQEYRKDRTYTYIYTEDQNYEPLAQITTYNGSDKAREILYYHNDQIGIPREMTDEEGNIVWSGDYSGWGKLTQEGRLKLDIHQPFRLQNQHYDEETGLHYNFFRYYDPEIGRFTQQDPIRLAGGESLYIYAFNISRWTDVLGWETTPDIAKQVITACDKNNAKGCSSSIIGIDHKNKEIGYGNYGKAPKPDSGLNPIKIFRKWTLEEPINRCTKQIKPNTLEVCMACCIVESQKQRNVILPSLCQEECYRQHNEL